MINMSYCRFNNTKLALDECLDTLREEAEISEEEIRQAKRMFGDFIDFLLQEGIIEDYDGDIDDRLDEYFERVAEFSNDDDDEW